MREIKFRGMTANGDWVYGFVHTVPRVPSKYQRVNPGTYISNSAGSPFAYQVKSETVGEFTGLKDKNGVEIYEGDIVSFVDHKEPQMTERYGIIRYREWSASYVIRTHLFAYNDWINYCCEVIGNIHGNTELLEGETK